MVFCFIFTLTMFATGRCLLTILLVLLIAETAFGFIFFVLNPLKKARSLIKHGKELSSNRKSLHKGADVVDVARVFGALLEDNQQIPHLRPESSLAAKPRDKSYDPCKKPQMCMNEGECINRNGNFDCKCKKGFIGKQCELEVSHEHCDKNLCQHESNCYSVPETYHVLDVVALKEAKVKFPGQTINSMDYRKEISYRCDCLEGYSGDLCELTPNDLYCQTDFCLNNGEGEWNATSGIAKNCICKCDAGFEGTYCEYMNPCFSNDVCHFGTCKDNKKEKLVNGSLVIEYAETCDCGSNFPFTDVKIEGENCTNLIIETADENVRSVIPCANLSSKDSKSLTQWIENVKTYQREMKLSPEDIKTLESLPLSCKTPKVDSMKGGDPALKPEEWEDCSYVFNASGTFCFNGATCEPYIMKMSSGVKLLRPHCNCDDLGEEYEGNFCQYKKENPCHPTFEEFVKGITLNNRCTSLTNGVCSPNVRKGEAVCICNPGYIGMKCERFDPCAEMPCSENSKCVALDPDINRPGSGAHRLYQCVCNDGYVNVSPTSFHCQLGNRTNKCAEKGLCQHGACFDCGKKAPEGNFEMCNDHELVLGYKCFCEPGWSGYHCDHELSVCSKSECKNGAICRQTEEYDYECICRPGTRGTFCEFVDDYCIAFGNEKCVNGKCAENDRFSRKFKCECFYGFGGLDCDIEIPAMTLLWNFWEENEPWCLGLSSAALLLVLLICHHLFLEAKQEVEEEEGEKEEDMNEDEEGEIKEEMKDEKTEEKRHEGKKEVDKGVKD